MRIAILIVLFFCFPALSVAGPQPPVDEVAEFEFGGLHFGEPPAPDMICTRGPCPSAQLGVGINHQKTILSGYKHPVDLTHYAEVEISAPRYDFFADQFVQASFRILCDPVQADICAMTVVEALDQHYRLTLEQEHLRITSPNMESTFQRYRTASGKQITLHRDKVKGQWQNPVVKLYDEALMQTVRQAANPKYSPK